MPEILIYILLANGEMLRGPGTPERCASLAETESKYASRGQPIPAASRDGRRSHVVKWWCESVRKKPDVPVS